MTSTFPIGESGAAVTRIDHIGIVVEDLDEAIAHFITRYGFRQDSRQLIDAVGAESAFLSVAGQSVQLLKPNAPGPIRSYLEEKGQGVHHLCLEVPSIEDALQALPGELETPVVTGGRGKRTCFLADDRHGVVIELSQVPQL
ncbi:methylmalonyl-CoA/ethylmalonyl-CoA epimerase [Rhodococcus sp. 27YEA15]|uniref:VOC family protein n=1 Tax=Rhodococcus sp. 27YEA15 TaxID=3156259 RepID=UPI003C7AD77B